METPQAVNNGGTFIWTLESVTSGRSRMRLPRNESFPEKGDSVLKLKKKQMGGRFMQDMGFPCVSKANGVGIVT